MFLPQFSPNFGASQSKTSFRFTFFKCNDFRPSYKNSRCAWRSLRLRFFFGASTTPLSTHWHNVLKFCDIKSSNFPIFLLLFHDHEKTHYEYIENYCFHSHIFYFKHSSLWKFTAFSCRRRPHRIGAPFSLYCVEHKHTFSYSHFSSQFLVSAFVWISGTIPLLTAASFFLFHSPTVNTTGALLSATFCILSLLCSVCKASRYCFVETTAYFLFPVDILMTVITILWEISNCHQQTKAQMHSYIEAIIQGRLNKTTDN